MIIEIITDGIFYDCELTDVIIILNDSGRDISERSCSSLVNIGVCVCVCVCVAPTSYTLRTMYSCSCTLVVENELCWPVCTPVSTCSICICVRRDVT